MYVLLLIILISSSNGGRAGVSNSTDFSSLQNCLIARNEIAKQLDRGNITIGCFKK